MQEATLKNKPEATSAVADNLLEKAILATKKTERSQAEGLLKTLTEKAMEGTVSWDHNLTKTLNQAVKSIDEKMSELLANVMHHEAFSQLEGTWRGLNHLVMNTETSRSLRIKMVPINKRELYKDLNKAVEFDQSQLYKKIYESEFGMPGGEPYGILVGDYEFGNHPQDIEMLSKISNVAAAAFCPFISAANSTLFDFDDWRELAKPRDLEKIFDSIEYEKWQSFRNSEDSRFVNLTLPRALARLPYGKATAVVDEFDYEECPANQADEVKVLEHKDYCWMNSSYVLSTKITNAFSKYGWCTAIRGAENGGKVDDLPLHVFMSEEGDLDSQCPTEVGITDRREAELSKLGFLPLCHYKGTDYAVFFGGQSVQKPKKYDRPAASANAEISARLPYLLATSRFAHYLKVMARDKIGSFMEAEDCESWLNRWIKNYVNSSDGISSDARSRYPLRDAKIEVKEVPSKPGAYQAVAWMRPWLQFEELTTSMRMVAEIPKLSK